METKGFEREVLDRLMRLETKIDLQDYKGLSEKVDKQHDTIIHDEQIIENHEKRISKIESSNSWMWKTIIGAFITGAIGIVFVLIKIGLGVE